MLCTRAAALFAEGAGVCSISAGTRWQGVLAGRATGADEASGVTGLTRTRTLLTFFRLSSDEYPSEFAISHCRSMDPRQRPSKNVTSVSILHIRFRYFGFLRLAAANLPGPADHLRRHNAGASPTRDRYRENSTATGSQGVLTDMGAGG
jgi:hypothetical protein